MNDGIRCDCGRRGGGHPWSPGEGCPPQPTETRGEDPQTEALRAIAVGIADLGRVVAEVADIAATASGVTTGAGLKRRPGSILPVDRIEAAVREVVETKASIMGDGWIVRPPGAGRGPVVWIDVDALP